VYAAGAAASILWLTPFFALLGTLSPAWIIVGFVLGLGLFYPAMLAPQAAYFAELFDTRTRLSGFAFAREIGSVLAGGFLPLVATALLAWAGHWWAVVVYMGVLTTLTLAALAAGPETQHKDIIDDEVKQRGGGAQPAARTARPSLSSDTVPATSGS
jgi:MFS family permease